MEAAAGQVRELPAAGHQQGGVVAAGGPEDPGADRLARHQVEAHPAGNGQPHRQPDQEPLLRPAQAAPQAQGPTQVLIFIIFPYKSLQEVPRTQVRLHHQRTHEQVHHSVRQKTAVEAAKTSLHPHSPHALSRPLAAWLHHGCRRVGDLHLAHEGQEGKGEDVGGDCGDDEAVGRRFRDQLDPREVDEEVLEEEQGGASEEQLGLGLSPD